MLAACTAAFSHTQPEPNHIIFINESTSFDEGTIHYYWDFGDGQTSYETNTEHIYAQPGIYSVSLSIITSELCYDREIRNVYVGIPPNSPYCQLEILFETTNATAPNYDDGTALVYCFSDVPCCYYAYWSNGDEGELISELEPGTYCVTLTNGEECYGTNCVTIGYNNNCTASFLVDSTSFSHLHGAYRFVNNSHGEEDFFYWDFGDGTSLFGHNPLHIYDEPGTYNVCLEIHTVYGCIDSFCQEITVGNTYPVITNLHGYVSAGETLLPEGIAVLYKYVNNYFTAIDYTLINEGQYQFSDLSKENLYLTHLIPHFDTEETYFPKYIATYSDNEIYWHDNSFINLYTDTIYYSSLQSYNEIYYDQGSISGVVAYDNLNSYEEDVFAQSWITAINHQEGYASNMVVLLKNENKDILDFKLTDENGFFVFEDLEYGSYYLAVEKAGLPSDEIFITINNDIPESTNNNFNIKPSRISGLEPTPQLNDFIIFPNPCFDNFTIQNISLDVKQIEIFNSEGKLIKIFTEFRDSLDISLSDCLSGVYVVKITKSDEVIIKKLIKF
ncbi:MAG: hypothetical protein C0596_02665 [Marinilabiliales bacterium]|nr:MAG: hypothetical protein C0596_02665 [Marinilabiliales bacterium]